MKETGLMFKAPLVRAILEDRKTLTRRIAQLPHMNPLGEWEPTTVGGPGGGLTRDGKEIPLQVALGHTRTGDVICAPYQAGDRIYVREAHAHHPQFAQMAFRADGEEFEDADGFLWAPKWTPAIHMKKEEARIWLEITGVRVERLQSITEADCIAEGAAGGHDSIPGYQYSATPLEHFRHIWESTGGDWAANPWLWVIDFKTISTTGRPASARSKA